MADTPTDGTSETGAPPPPRRRTRGESTATKTARAKPTASRAKRTTAKTPADAKAAPKAAAKTTAAPKTIKPRAKKPAAPRVKAPARAKAATTAVASSPVDAARKFGIGKLVAIGAAAVAAGVAALLGRKKIAGVSNDAMDAVMGKGDKTPAAAAEVKDLKSAD